jgi:hypothetical protein
MAAAPRLRDGCPAHDLRRLIGSLAAKECAADTLVDIDNVDLEAAVTRVAQSQA